MKIKKLIINSLRYIWNILFPPSITEKKLIYAWIHNRIPQSEPVSYPHHAVWSYGFPLVRKAIRELKTRRNTVITKIFAEALHHELLSIIAETPLLQRRRIICIPVPVTRKRLYERGFNQALYIAKQLASRSSNYIVEKHILRKIRETSKQALHTGRTQRQENVRGAYVARQANNVRQSDVLVIIDDVTTTGATMRSCLQAFEKSGYTNPIITLSVAH